jgi:hypothetical protein
MRAESEGIAEVRASQKPHQPADAVQDSRDQACTRLGSYRSRCRY